MKLVIEEAANGFIVEVKTELMISGVETPGTKHIFTEMAVMQEFIKDFYTQRPNMNTPPRTP